MDYKTELLEKARQTLAFTLSDLNEALGHTTAVESLVVLDLVDAIAMANTKLSRLMKAMEDAS